MPRFVRCRSRPPAFLVALTTTVAAQDYPSKPIRMIIPFPPGGGSDIAGRVVASALERTARQAGDRRQPRRRRRHDRLRACRQCAEGRLHAADGVARAHGQSVACELKGRYDPIKSFAPVAMIAASPVVLVVNPNAAGAIRGGAVALAKKQPGKLQYASAGVGSVTHLAGELFKYSAKVDMLHMPFKGAGPATVDVVGGHTA